MATSSPIRIEGPRPSRCCTWPTVLVQSMDGGFVTSNCTKCGKSGSLSHYDFLHVVRCAVDCPTCGDRMHKAIVWKNYAFECPSCRTHIRLADLVPWWYAVEPHMSRLAALLGD